MKIQIRNERNLSQIKMDEFIKIRPYAHQEQAFIEAIKILNKNKAFALLSDMGTGKTLISISLIGALLRQKKINKVLIVCPKSIIEVWKQEFNKYAAYRCEFCDINPNVINEQIRKKTLQIYLINYESCWRKEKLISKWKPDVIICDESSKIKNPQSKQSKALHRLGRISKYNMILTGTPIVNNPLDFFSQYKFLDYTIFGSSFYGFRARYADIGLYHVPIKYKNMAELTRKAHSIAYRIKLDDAVELPKSIDQVRLCQLESTAKNIYSKIDKDSYAKLIEGEITTTNVLTRLLRLSQCTGGFVYIENEGNKSIKQVSNAKLNIMEDIIERCVEENKKVIIFARFLPEIDVIEKSLKVQYSLVKGDVKDRAEEVRKFQEDKDVKVFIGQIATTGMGLTLTAASVVVYYSLDYSYANYIQSKARIRRIGQSKKCLYIHLIAKDTIDEKVMEALKRKENIAKLLVDEYKLLSRTSSLNKQ